MSEPLVYEVGDSQSGTVDSDFEAGDVFQYTRRFVVGPVDGILDAFDNLKNYAPRWFVSPLGHIFTRKKLDLKNVGANYYEAVSEYSTLIPSREAQDEEAPAYPLGISWDTTGHTEHITQAYGTTVTPAADAPEVFDAINVSGDSVAGLDVVRPSLRYSETWLFPTAMAVSGTFVSAVYGLTGTVNEQAFRFFDPGEALFMGARTQWSGGEPFVYVTFDFECRPNDDDVYVNGITGVEKEGWQYLWIWYEPKANNNKLVRFPEFVFVQDVYKKADWSDLEIPGIAPVERAGLDAQAAENAAAAFFA